jgi:nitric oxide reductase activation protein
MPSLPPHKHVDSRYQGFSLSSVCWGYRDIFSQALEALFDQELLGETRPEVTERFFALMRCAEEQAFDHVLREFLAALTPRTAWIMDLPGIFAEVTEMGRQLAESKLYYGVTYFRVLGEGGFGGTPQQVHKLIICLHRLRVVDDELAVAFLRGYRRLAERLEPSEIDVYLQEGIAVYARNHKTGLQFMQGTLKTSEIVIRTLTSECRLEDVQPGLERMLRALVGYEVEVQDLGRLDSDDLIERGTRLVCLYRWLYLSVRVRHFDHVTQNRNWYWLSAVVAAGMLSQNSFCRVQGHPGFSTCADLVGGDTLRVNLLQLIEYARVLSRIRAMWPGARRLVAFGIATEFEALPADTPVDRLLNAVLRGVDGVPLARQLLDLAQASVNVFDSASLLTAELERAALQAYPGLGRNLLRTLSFVPDFMYPGVTSEVPPDALVADLKQEAQDRREHRLEEDQRTRQPHDEDADTEGEEKEGSVEACYVYDEWSQPEGDYYSNYCRVHEMRPADVRLVPLPEEVSQLAARTRHVFEMLRPKWIKEKRLPEGDEINVDRLTNYFVLRTIEPSPKVDFYEKPRRDRRDLAVLILLDVSGSTGQDIDRTKTIEIEKRAALILGQGLSVLDDRFAVCGFSGNGREHCEFYVYKGFYEEWDREAMSCVLAAYPRSATRIGAALRHAGYRLSTIAAKQRLIILITDGKPTDTGYDPNTRYAQHDVRMACVENRHMGIHTFCVSTLENSRADMEIMFPDRMFAILPHIRHLPRILPRLYIKMTV